MDSAGVPNENGVGQGMKGSNNPEYNAAVQGMYLICLYFLVRRYFLITRNCTMGNVMVNTAYM